MCAYCGTYSRLDRVFCVGCGRRLLKPSQDVLRVEDFASEADRSSLETLKATEPLPHLVERLAPFRQEQSETWLMKNGTRIRPTSKLDTLIRGCAEILGVERLPRAYIAPSDQANAFTTGKDDDPILVLCSPLLDILDYVEMEGLVSHELAHVRSRHVLYHSLAETVASGVQMAASPLGAGLLSIPIKMILLSWYRESEVSADRASLLILGNYGVFESIMAKLAAADETGGAAAVRDGSMAELMQTHPSIQGRLRLAKEFGSSRDYALARGRVLAAAASSSSMSACRYCGFVSPRAEVFCPSCSLGRS